MRSKNKEFLGLELSLDLLNKLKEEANKHELSTSAFVRMVLIDYMSKKDDSERTKN